MVQPLASAPSPADPILFRFYAGLTGPQGGQFKSDQLYTIVVWDTVRTSDPKKQSNATTGYDSNYAATVPVSDVPVAGSAKILIGYMLAAPVKPLSSISNNGAKFFVNGNQLTKIKNVKQYDTTTVTAGTVNFEAQVGSPNIDTDVKFSFTAESGGIYEAFFVGQRGRPNDAAKYGPRWIVVRVNPIRN